MSLHTIVLREIDPKKAARKSAKTVGKDSCIPNEIFLLHVYAADANFQLIHTLSYVTTAQSAS